MALSRSGPTNAINIPELFIGPRILPWPLPLCNLAAISTLPDE